MVAVTTHIYQKSIYNLEDFPVVFWGRFTSANWDATGWETANTVVSADSLGIQSVIRTGQGVYRVTLKSRHAKVLSVSLNAAASLYCYVSDDSVSEATPYFDITCADDPTDGATALLRVELRT